MLKIREPLPWFQASLIRLGSLMLALFLGGSWFALLGYQPEQVFTILWQGALQNEIARAATLKTALPLTGAALALLPAFRMGFWNIGAEGQIMLGAIGASLVALFVPTAHPLPLMLGAALLFGGFWGLLPALFKAYRQVNETLFSLMLNYIAIGLTVYLVSHPWRDPAGTYPKAAMFSQSARLPEWGGLSLSWLFILGVIFFLAWYLNYTRSGYELTVLGESPKTAHYAGMPIVRIILQNMFLSGALAGLVGFLLVSGSAYTLTPNTSANYGYTAIAVAWLGRLNPWAMFPIAFLIAILNKGSQTLQTVLGIPSSGSEVLLGILFFAMLIGEFFIRYQISRKDKP
ncbi:MAG: ABC transporter permease [Clostridia bacterium]|nr:ABC transporter permease [Clostridia bacterium]